MTFIFMALFACFTNSSQDITKIEMFFRKPKTRAELNNCKSLLPKILVEMMTIMPNET